MCIRDRSRRRPFCVPAMFNQGNNQQLWLHCLIWTTVFVVTRCCVQLLGICDHLIHWCFFLPCWLRRTPPITYQFFGPEKYVTMKFYCKSMLLVLMAHCWCCLEWCCKWSLVLVMFVQPRCVERQNSCGQAVFIVHGKPSSQVTGEWCFDHAQCHCHQYCHITIASDLTTAMFLI